MARRMAPKTNVGIQESVSLSERVAVGVMVASIAIFGASLAAIIFFGGKGQPGGIPASVVYPRLFYTRTDIQEFVDERLSTPWIATDYADIKADADALQSTFTCSEMDSTDEFFDFDRRLENAGFAYLVERELGHSYAVYQTKVRNFFVRAVSCGVPTGPFPFDVFSAESLIHLAGAYDAIADSLTDTDRNNFSGVMRDVLDQIQTDDDYNAQDNKGVIAHAGTGIVGIAIGDNALRDEGMGTPTSFPIGSMRWALRSGFNDDGHWREPTLKYHEYTSRHMFAALRAAWRNGDDLFAQIPGAAMDFQETQEALILATYPNLIKTTYGDADYGRGVSMWLVNGVHGQYKARGSESAILAYALDHYEDLGHGRGAGIPYVLISSAATYTVPAGYRLPSQQFPQTGIGILRTDASESVHEEYANLDFNLSSVNHDHSDEMDLDLWAAGEPLIPNLGGTSDFERSTIAQNVVVINHANYGRGRPSGRSLGYGVTDRRKLQITHADVADWDGDNPNYSQMVGYERLAAKTPEYTLDLFSLDGPSSRTYDFVLHGFGSFQINGVTLQSVAPLGHGTLINYRGATGVSGPFQTTWISGNAKVKSFFVGKSGTSVYTAEAPDDRDEALENCPSFENASCHIVLLVRRSTTDTQYAVVHDMFTGASGEVTGVTERLGGVGDNRYHARIALTNGRTDELLANRSATPSQQTYNEYSFNGKSAVIRNTVAGVSGVYTVLGNKLQQNATVLVDTFGQSSSVESTRNGIVTILGSGITQYRIFAPGATSVFLNGVSVAFNRDGDFVTNGAGLPICQNNVQITQPCLCGGEEHNTGYCCDGVWQPGPCAEANQLPIITLTAPRAGDRVSGTIQVRAEGVTDPDGTVTLLEFLVDNQVASYVNNPGQIVTWSWNTTTTTNGDHTLRVRVTDNDEGIGLSAIVPVAVDNVIAVFSDNFNDGNANGWTSVTPWIVSATGESSYYHRSNFPGAGITEVQNRTFAERPLEVTVRVKKVLDQGIIGLHAFQQPGSATTYALFYDTSQNSLRLYRNGVHLAGITPVLDLRNWHIMKFRFSPVTGIIGSIQKEGEPTVYQLTYTDPNPLASGTIGLYCNNGGDPANHCRFDDVLVTTRLLEQPGGGGGSPVFLKIPLIETAE